ncbi:immunoglobulin domain-containing protein, partial [Burkholderia pseudomallei]|uniref:immunoglobulin domain-containing protein n=1 Tax=Burkholderia pseudomallei TaxID=28450 RepID=UPI00358FA865
AARLIPLSPRTWILRVRGEGITRYAVWPQAWDTGSPTPFGLKAGDTAFWINGYSLSANNARVVPINRDRPATRADWGDRVYRMEQSEWRQDAASVEGLADALLADLAAPRLELRDISVPPDLRWEIGDVVTLTDWAGRVPDITARITRIQLTIAHNEESGMRGVYSLRALPPVAPTITAQPSSTSVAPGTPATFTAAGTGEPAPTVTWQVNDGSGWHDA